MNQTSRDERYTQKRVVALFTDTSLISAEWVIYPKSLELHGGGKRVRPHELSRTK